MLRQRVTRQDVRDERASRASDLVHKERATRGEERDREKGDKQRRAENPDLQQDRQEGRKRPPSGAARRGAPAAGSRVTQTTGRAREESTGDQNENYDTGD